MTAHATLLFALVAALAVPDPSASVAPCTSSEPIALPQLSSATQDDLREIRALVGAKNLGAAGARWGSLNARTPASSAAAYGAADAAFSARKYRTAFRLYDRILFCGQTTELNPAAQDSGAAASLDAALQRAAAGDFSDARKMLQSAAERDPASTESRYFLGLVESARGDSGAAHRAWKAAIDSEGYTQPPDGWTMPRAQEAAIQRYLSSPSISSTRANI